MIRSETRVKYKYQDARGNWTEMVVQVRSGENQEFCCPAKSSGA